MQKIKWQNMRNDKVFHINGYGLVLLQFHILIVEIFYVLD